MNAVFPLESEHTHAHAATVRRCDLVLIGARGRVGTALRRWLVREATALRERAGVDLRLIAAFDTRGFASDDEGLPPGTLDLSLRPRHDGDWLALRARLGQGVVPRIVIDCTASDAIANDYPALLAAGVGVVAANKRANARSLASYRHLQRLSQAHGAPYRYETTVGAAIPILAPLRELRLRGERVVWIEGVLSGSLSYILGRMQDDDLAFSQAVAQAQALGLTEPNPLEDLQGADLVRKLLVLAREAGFALELEAVDVLPVTDASVDDADEVIAALATEDHAWRERIAAARERNERLVVVAEADANGGRIGVRNVPRGSPLAALSSGENRLRVFTEVQQAPPLMLCGPGAGPEITAAGVFGDVILAAQAVCRATTGNIEQRMPVAEVL